MLIEHPLRARLCLRCWDTVTNERNTFCPLVSGFAPASSSSSLKTQLERPFLRPAFPETLTTPCVFRFCERLSGTCLMAPSREAQRRVHRSSAHAASQSRCSSEPPKPSVLLSLVGISQVHLNEVAQSPSPLRSWLAPWKPRPSVSASLPLTKAPRKKVSQAQRLQLPSLLPIWSPRCLPGATPVSHEHFQACLGSDLALVLAAPGTPAPFLLLLHSGAPACLRSANPRARAHPRPFALAVPPSGSLSLQLVACLAPSPRSVPSFNDTSSEALPGHAVKRPFCSLVYHSAYFLCGTNDSHFRVYSFARLFLSV